VKRRADAGREKVGITRWCKIELLEEGESLTKFDAGEKKRVCQGEIEKTRWHIQMRKTFPDSGICNSRDEEERERGNVEQI